MMSKCRFALSLPVAVLLGCPVSAQETADRFQIRTDRGGLKGAEEFRIEKTDSGYRLTSKTDLDQGGRPMGLAQELSLGADWGLLRYRLEATVGGQVQTIEAWRDDAKIEMRVNAGGKQPSSSAPYSPAVLVLDNLVVSHYQVLLHRLAADPTAAEWTLLVPQRLAAVKGKVARGDRMDGKLGAEKVQVRKFILEIGGVLIEFWGEEPSNRLMLITVPVQGLSMAREGFELLSPPSPGGGAKPGIVERPISFSSGGLEMPGTLCLPESQSARLPIVILVHGSGPNDRDETIGPNKPFRDLAQGLAAGGIASLRYDKRTFAFRDKMNPRTVTLDQEVIDDAVAALKYGASRPEADPSRVFLLGHSMGGSLAPLIAERSGQALRGVVLMAAAARPLDEIVAEQVAFQMKVAGVAEAEITSKTAELKSAFARIRSGRAPEDEVVLFAPARYWRELFRLDIGAAVSRLRAPVLVLQGGRDIQIGRRDYDLIQKALASVPDDRKEFRWFEGLNHLFMEVTGESTGSEYGRAGQVHPEVIGTIMAWIRKRA